MATLCRPPHFTVEAGEAWRGRTVAGGHRILGDADIQLQSAISIQGPLCSVLNCHLSFHLVQASALLAGFSDFPLGVSVGRQVRGDADEEPLGHGGCPAGPWARKTTF